MLPPELTLTETRGHAYQQAKDHAISLATESAPIAEHLYVVQCRYTEARVAIGSALTSEAVGAALRDWLDWTVAVESPPEMS